MKKLLFILTALTLLPKMAMAQSAWQLHAEGQYGVMSSAESDPWSASVVAGKGDNGSFVGLGTGFWHEADADLIPLFLKMKYGFAKTAVTPYGVLRAGMSLNKSEDWSVGFLGSVGAGLDTSLTKQLGLYFEATAQIHSHRDHYQRGWGISTGDYDTFTSVALTLGLRCNLCK